MEQGGLILIEKGCAAVTFRCIASLNIPATCNFFYASCQWDSLMIAGFFKKISWKNRLEPGVNIFDIISQKRY
jgi:hypothetical protein